MCFYKKSFLSCTITHFWLGPLYGGAGPVRLPHSTSRVSCGATCVWAFGLQTARTPQVRGAALRAVPPAPSRARSKSTLSPGLLTRGWRREAPTIPGLGSMNFLERLVELSRLPVYHERV